MSKNETSIVPIEDPLSLSKEKLEAHLKRWDRDLSEENRCYGMKLLLAGAEQKKVRDGLYRAGIRHILVSYYYLRKWLKNRPAQEIAEDFGRFDFVFLDSGGYTLMVQNEKEGVQVDINEYSSEYYTELKRIGSIFAGCAEVDLPNKLGWDYYESIKQEMVDEGVPIVPVMHGKPLEFYGDLGWFDDYPYIAIGSLVLTTPSYRGWVNQVFDVCKEKGILVHGFGVTDTKTMLKSQYYSCDSTTWLNGSKFGSTMVFENGRIRHYDHLNKAVRRRFKKRFEDNGIIWSDIEADKGFEVDMMNALAWKQLGDYVRYSAIRSYWLTPEEKDRALTLKSKAFNAEGVIDRKVSIERAEARRLLAVEDPDSDDRSHEILHCDTCHVTGRCPRWKAGEACGYDINVRLESQGDLQKMLQILLEAQYGRVMTGVLFEKLEGGVLDKNLSAELQRTIGMVADIKSIFAPRVEEEIEIRAKGGKGALSSILAGVFAPTGVGKSGSGNSQVQRAANKIIDVEPDVSED